MGLFAPRPRERSALDPFVSCGDSFLTRDKELKDFKEFKELKECGAHRGSNSHRKQRSLSPLLSPTPILLKLLKLLKLLILKLLKSRRRPVSFCGAASRRPLRKLICALRYPVPKIVSCETFRGRASRLPFIRRVCAHARTRSYARTRTLSRASAHGHARAPCRVQFETRTGFVSNLYGFHFKPVRVSRRPCTGLLN